MGIKFCLLAAIWTFTDLLTVQLCVFLPYWLILQFEIQGSYEKKNIYVLLSKKIQYQIKIFYLFVVKKILRNPFKSDRGNILNIFLNKNIHQFSI